jgi:DNA polymerase I-like protein with 3'-5' exonuclease and polymerase domains
MYGGSAYSYANDPDFTEVSTSEKFWQKVIDAFYTKYSGLRNWHIQIVQEAMQNGQLVMPTGRVYKYELKRDFRGELKAPETIIKNYPVQGLGADVMAIIRVSFRRRFINEGINGVLVNTVHDSIVADIDEQEVERCNLIFHSVFADFPSNFQRVFGIPFDLPLNAEVSIGNNMKELEEIA